MIAPGVKSPAFIDSNIWLYALLLQQDVAKMEQASRLLAQVGRDALISSQVVIEVVANLIKKRALDEDGVRVIIESMYAQYKVVESNRSVMLDASRLRGSYALSYWDSLIVAAALTANASILYSEDLQNGLIIDTRLKIVNPFEPPMP